MGLEVPAQCDGYPLTPFLDGVEPDGWRDAAHYEWDWRDVFIGRGEHAWPWDRRLERQHLAVLRSDGLRLRAVRRRLVEVLRPRRRPDVADRGRRPGGRARRRPGDAGVALQHAERTFTDMLLRDGGIGRVPAGVPRR